MSAILRLSVLAATIASVLSPAQAAEKETANSQKKSKDIITVYATGNQRDSFEAPMMVTVIKNNSPQTQTASTANDILKKYQELMFLVRVALMAKMFQCVALGQKIY